MSNLDAAWEAYEKLPESYHNDFRWELVISLRREGKDAEANGLVLQIRTDYGFQF